MASYAVDTGHLRVCAEQLSGLQRELDSVALRLTGFQVGTTLQMRGSAVLMARIGDCKWAVINQSDNLGRMSRGLVDAMDLYERCERNLTEPQTQAQAQARAEAQQEEAGFWGELLEYFPLLETIGFGIEAVGRLVWDLTDVFSDAVGWVMSGIESIWDNVEEFAGDLFNAQFLFELVGEAAVDFGLGFGVGAAIVAVVGAPATIGAALCISAASAAICWVGDTICRWITEDDISELIVDFTWDAINWIGDGVESVVDAAGEIVSDAFAFVQEGAEALWNSAGEFIDTLLPW